MNWDIARVFRLVYPLRLTAQADHGHEAVIINIL